MSTAAQVRAQIEAKIGARIPAAFAIRANRSPRLLPTGIPAIDAMLGGGVPLGHLTEITGAGSTGKTGLAIGVVAAATRKGAACAWIDVLDSFDPESAAACNVDLRRLLWLRAGRNTQQDDTPSKAFVAPGPRPAGTGSSHAGQHPRHEVRNMGPAVADLFSGGTSRSGRDKRIGTPGMPNLPLPSISFEPRCAEPQHHRRVEQVASDRLPPRRGDGAARQTIQPVTMQRSEKRCTGPADPAEKPWSRLDQALRATDLLLQAGGFNVVVLDLADVRADHATKIPLAAWYRFRLAAERAQTALIVLTDIPCAKSCTELHLSCACEAGYERWQRAGETPLLTGLGSRVHIVRNRSESTDSPLRKKPVASVHAAWSSHAAWTR
jgi:recombination protein RecA